MDNSNSAFINKCLQELEIESNEQFADQEKNKVARKCIKHIGLWMSNCYASGMVYTKNDKRRLRKDCYTSVRESVINDYKEEYGFAILTFLLIYVILPMVLKWLIERLFNKLN